MEPADHGSRNAGAREKKIIQKKIKILLEEKKNKMSNYLWAKLRDFNLVGDVN